MKTNIATRLRRRDAPMSAYDRLPRDLRLWLHQAALPWSPQTALRLWQRALRESAGDTAQARARLERAQARTLARDAPRVWGPSHPAAV
jgi:hypothetical protein